MVSGTSRLKRSRGATETQPAKRQHEVYRREHDNAPLSFGDTALAAKTKNYASKQVQGKVKPSPRRKKKFLVPRALRKKSTITSKPYSQPSTKSQDSEPAEISVASKALSKDTATCVPLASPSPSGVHRDSPEIPLQSTSLRSSSVSSDVESSSDEYIPSKLNSPSSPQSIEQSDSSEVEKTSPAKPKQSEKSIHQTVMKVSGLVDDIVNARKQSPRAVLYDFFGSPESPKGRRKRTTPNKRLSLITRDNTSKYRELKVGHRSRLHHVHAAKHMATAAECTRSSTNGSQTNDEEVEANRTILTQSTLGVGEDGHLVPRAGSPSSDSSGDDHGRTESSSKDNSRNEARFRKLPKRRLIAQLDREAHKEPKDNQAAVSANEHSQQSDENQTIVSEQSLSCSEVSEDTNMGVVNDANTEGATDDLKQNLDVQIKLNDSDFTVDGSSSPETVNDDAFGREARNTRKQKEQLSDEDLQEPGDVLGVGNSTSNTEDEDGSSSERSKLKLKSIHKLKKTLIKLTSEDFTTECSLLQESGRGTIENTEDDIRIVPDKRQGLKPKQAATERSIKLSSLQSVRVVLDALSLQLIKRIQKTRGGKGKIAKRSQWKKSSTPPLMKNVAKLKIERADLDNVVVKDLVDNNSEHCSKVTSLTPTTAEIPGAEEVTKAVDSEPPSRPLGMASSTDDDNTSNFEEDRTRIEVPHHSEQEAIKRKLTSEQSSEGAEDSEMEIDVQGSSLSEGSVNECMTGRGESDGYKGIDRVQIAGSVSLGMHPISPELCHYEEQHSETTTTQSHDQEEHQDNTRAEMTGSNTRRRKRQREHCVETTVQSHTQEDSQGKATAPQPQKQVVQQGKVSPSSSTEISLKSRKPRQRKTRGGVSSKSTVTAIPTTNTTTTTTSALSLREPHTELSSQETVASSTTTAVVSNVSKRSRKNTTITQSSAVGGANMNTLASKSMATSTMEDVDVTQSKRRMTLLTSRNASLRFMLSEAEDKKVQILWSCIACCPCL